MKLPNPQQLVYTIGVMSEQGKGFDRKEHDYMFTKGLSLAVLDSYNSEPDECSDGGNDKYFFTTTFRNVKYFVAANEVGGLTVMRPDEY